MNFVERDIRATSLRGNCVDIDFCNARPSLMTQIVSRVATGTALPTLARFGPNYELWREWLAYYLNISLEEAKLELIKRRCSRIQVPPQIRDAIPLYIFGEVKYRWDMFSFEESFIFFPILRSLTRRNTPWCNFSTDLDLLRRYRFSSN